MSFFQNKNFWAMSLERYSLSHYNFLKYSKLNFFISILIYPLFGLFAIYNSNNFLFKRNKFKKMVIDCKNSVIYKKYFVNIIKNISDKDLGKIGNDLDHDVSRDNFKLSHSVIITLILIFTWPIAILISLILMKNYMQAIIRTLLVYFKTLNFFEITPCDIYVTYEDNKCSPAFYKAFKDSGGKLLVAIQNGHRVYKNGLSFTCVDHLFSINKKNIYECKSYNGFINDYTIIGPLVFANHSDLALSKEKKYDIMFIDQTENISDFEFNIKDKIITSPNKKYLDDIKTFVKKNLHISYCFQLRNKYTANELKTVNEFFKDTSIKVYQNNKFSDSYSVMQFSNLIVTNYSTMGIEGIYMGKKVLFTNHMGDQDYSIINDKNYQIESLNYEVFEKSILNILNNNPLMSLNNGLGNIDYKNLMNTQNIITNKLEHFIKSTKD